MNAEEKYNYVIYLHRNLMNGKVYIGQTVQLPSLRWANGKGYPSNPHFKRAIEKYGWNNFKHIILEDFIATPEEAGKKEQQYIDIYNSTNPEYGYNIRGGVTQLPYSMVEKAVQWMKEHPEFGLERAAVMHKWKEEHPEEALAIILKMQKAGAEARKRRVRCIETGLIYDSMTEAAKCISGASQSKISMCCNGKRNTCAGFHWEYAPKEVEDE